MSIIPTRFLASILAIWATAALADGPDPDVANTMRKLHAECEQGDMNACAKGAGVLERSRNGPDVIKWLEFACLKGHTPSCISRGSLATSTSKMLEARRWYAVACKRSDGAIACSNLAQIDYSEGLDRKRALRLPEAEKFLRAACDAKIQPACYELALVIRELRPPEPVAPLLEGACTASVASACYELAREEKRRGEDDKAVEHFKQACEKGNACGCRAQDYREVDLWRECLASLQCVVVVEGCDVTAAAVLHEKKLREHLKRRPPEREPAPNEGAPLPGRGAKEAACQPALDKKKLATYKTKCLENICKLTTGTPQKALDCAL